MRFTPPTGATPPKLDRETAAHNHPEHARPFAPAPGFTDWTRHAYDWSATYAADTYAELVGTHSDHLMLEPSIRAALLRAITEAIEQAGAGRVEYRYRTLMLSAAPDRPPDADTQHVRRQASSP